MRSRPLENPELLDIRVTAVLVLAAAGLSVKRFMGFDLDLLIMDHRAWPQEPWRLFTSCLLHGGWMHLVFNLMWTLRFGSILEPILGVPRFLLLVFFLGVGPMAAQWTVSGPAVGLSGIGFGLFGVLFALDRHDARYRGVMSRDIAQLFGLWFAFCIVATYMDWMRVANIAHGAGFVLGYFAGAALSPNDRRRRLGWSALTVSTAALAFGATIARPYVNYSGARARELFEISYGELTAENYEEALPHLLRLVEILPDEPAGWNNLAVTYHRLNRPAEAERAMRRSNELTAELEQIEPEEPRKTLRDFFTRKLE